MQSEMRRREDGSHSPAARGAKTKLGFVPFPSQVLCPSFPDADVEGRDGPSLAETNSTLNLLSWEVGATLPSVGLSRSPTRELPAQSPRCLWEGSGATRPRHLMLFPAGGRTAEKSETPPSTLPPGPRGQSTKGGGRRERGWSHRVERAHSQEESASPNKRHSSHPLRKETQIQSPGARCPPLLAPIYTFAGCWSQLPGLVQTEGRRGPLAGHGETPEGPGGSPPSLTTPFRCPPPEA